MRTGRLIGMLLLVNLSAVAAGADEKKLPPLHHVIEVEVPDEMKIPEEFPLSDNGRIICKTCHGIEGIEDLLFDEVDREAEVFHRGGPYRRLTDFCYRCHDKKSYSRPNIHQLLDDKGEYDKKACEQCHVEVPDPKQENIVRSELKFHLPPQKLCYGCHLKTPHLNALNHQVEPDEEMRKRIGRAEQELGVILPLAGNGNIMCATCHTAHQRGLINPEWPAGRQVADTDLDEGVTYREHAWDEVFQADKRERLEKLSEEGGTKHALAYRRIEKEILLRLPARDGTLCMACHKLDDR